MNSWKTALLWLAAIGIFILTAVTLKANESKIEAMGNWPDLKKASVAFIMGALLIPAGIFVLGKTKTIYRRFLREFPADETEADVSKVIALVPAGLCGFFGVCLTWLGIDGIGRWIGYWAVQTTGQEAADYAVFSLSMLALIGISARQLLKKSA